MKKTFIIAEAGVNHNGELRKAKALAEAAKETGADAVKFQSFKADKLVSRRAAKAPYQERTAPKAKSQHELLAGLELTRDDHAALSAFCAGLGITFLSTPFDPESADLLEELGVPLFKLASGELTNKPLLEHVARKNKPMILSTGMSTLDEVRQAVGWVQNCSKAPLTLLHCVTEYPAPAEQVNLRAMDTLRRTFSLPVGYSDHTLGLEIALAAAALGAEVIEKHLTLDRTLAGPDQAASLEPSEFSRMVRMIRSIDSALGDGVKAAAPCEEANRLVARRSLVARRALKPGHVLSESDLDSKRPGDGIAPARACEVIGKTLSRALAEGESLTWEVLS